MDASLSATVVATVSKHAIGGTVAVVIGAVLIVFGVMRIAAKTAMALLYPIIGIGVLVVGVLLFTRTI